MTSSNNTMEGETNIWKRFRTMKQDKKDEPEQVVVVQGKGHNK
jgi:hypothetical protein